MIVSEDALKFADLKKYDSSLHLEYPMNWEGEICGLTSPQFPRAHHLVFIKDKRFSEELFKELEKNKPLFKEMIVVIERKFFESNPDLSTLQNNVEALFLSDNIKFCLTALSHPFYELMLKKADDTIDGRTDGSAKIHPAAKIAPHVFIGQHAQIGAGATIHAHSSVLAYSTIGEGTILYPNVTIYRNVKVGKNCRLHSSTVIGADGFGYEFQNGIHQKIWHMGGVIIEDNVEIGACSAIDSGTFVPTIIGAGSKIDNHVQVGHNGKLGKAVILCGQVGVSGSSIIGDYTVMGGKAGMGPDLELGAACQIAGNAMVTNDWPAKSVLAGHPARPLNEWMRGVAYIRRESLKKKE